MLWNNIGHIFALHTCLYDETHDSTVNQGVLPVCLIFLRRLMKIKSTKLWRNLLFRKAYKIGLIAQFAYMSRNVKGVSR